MRYNDDETVNATFETAAGAAALAVPGFVAAVLFPVTEPAGRVLIVAVAVGVLSALFRDRRAAGAVAIIAALVFVGFLAHRYGVLTGDATPWFWTPLIGCGALLGRGYRRMAHSPARGRASRDPSSDHMRTLTIRRIASSRVLRPGTGTSPL